jgi:hypothetical protein
MKNVSWRVILGLRAPQVPGAGAFEGKRLKRLARGSGGDSDSFEFAPRAGSFGPPSKTLALRMTRGLGVALISRASRELLALPECAAGEQQVLRLPLAIRFAYRQAGLRVTGFGECAIDDS